MAGLGDVMRLWHLPFHTFINLRTEYLAVVLPAPEKKDDDIEVVDMGHGVTMERSKS